jgi:uncharacterized protein
MKIEDYQLVEKYMLECMRDSAHDKEHIFRVLYTALDIAEHESNVNYDVLIVACLLHDIGRQEQFNDPSLCHAVVGAKKAYDFLAKNGFSAEFAQKVSSCIKVHRFRSSNPPTNIEEKILFDSDKIDVTGTLGIARTIFYKGQVGEPLYSLSKTGEVSDGSNDTVPSFFQEYKLKLEGLYSKFYTKRGKEIALQRQSSAVSFYENMLNETTTSYRMGIKRLSRKLK